GRRVLGEAALLVAVGVHFAHAAGSARASVSQNPRSLIRQPLAFISSGVRQRRSTPIVPTRCLSNVLTRLNSCPQAQHSHLLPVRAPTGPPPRSPPRTAAAPA